VVAAAVLVTQAAQIQTLLHPTQQAVVQELPVQKVTAIQAVQTLAVVVVDQTTKILAIVQTLQAVLVAPA
jgi:hypothetical protein